ncbi:acetyl-CoA synthetase-like protein [Metschnikowia bicuspidata var. bicuspidata NRRL YB-4993]|uniref:Acetyl-CoA synthetase-like protein n=1 Tax=Metschnikowia bicuspidata var. bicuspidata NRRL YB-4993 TaxID=869754 RepID=A0A1A0HDJ4_9ASCO|nr:acetyl-CoA synthetase-like protein [Metschnikowia bicuspidata var. bicuspidata NRRL YB-4993]OBA22086.1 acetyl-CoA synthetase-like protein [Metschnikowia bicuspidata var. bicuspidata NRRL YB-4993]
MSAPVLAPATSDSVFVSPAESGVSFDRLLDDHVPLAHRANASAVPGSAETGYSPVFRSDAVPNLKINVLPELATYHALWRNSVRHFAAKPALASRPYDYKTGVPEPRYEPETYLQVDEKKRRFGAGVIHLLQHSPYKNSGLESHRKIDRHYADCASYDATNLSFVLTMFLGNRAEWVITDLACVAYSITNTVLYDTLGPNASEYILQLVESPVVVASLAHVEAILDLKRSHPQELAALICVVSMDPLDCRSDAEARALAARARECLVELYDFGQVCGVGRLFPHPEMPPSPAAVYTISFTSGTTGSKPKGVVLTHETTSAGITFTICNVPRIKDDVEMVFLPLAHIFERQSLAYTLATGGLCGFPQLNGTPQSLLDDLRVLKPKHMSNVPRVFTKLEAAIKNATIHLDLVVKKTIFSHVVQAKLDRQTSDGVKGTHAVYDALFISKVRKLLGFENMEHCITGLAPISPLTIKFMKAALNIGFAQGYGLTELFAGMSFGDPNEKAADSCGAPGVATEIRVRELPDLGYTLDDPRGHMGELQLRGPQIFSAYYKNEEETRKSFDGEWFSTGDVARIDRNTGRLYIVDRVKNFFKLSQGEYVTPEKIENIYLLCNSILTQCFVHGDSTQSFLVAIVGVDKEKAATFLKHVCGFAGAARALDDALLAEINKPENRRLLLQRLNKHVAGLAGFEKLKNLYIEYEPLTLERDVITPTVKLKRPIAAKFFRPQIDQMYEEALLQVGSKL